MNIFKLFVITAASALFAFTANAQAGLSIYASTGTDTIVVGSGSQTVQLSGTGKQPKQPK